jgi:UDP-N-acetylmuramyl pentapeptide phosphotransferase/UDP-N-acetylglucosamine-1-phosphate transferase
LTAILHPQSLPGLALLAAIAFALSVVITYAAIRIARRYHLHAIPNERSSHTVPTPQVGGIGVALPVLAYLAYFAFRSEEYAILLWIGLPYFAIGLLDDFANMSPVAKLIAQFAAVLAPFIFVAGRSLSSGQAPLYDFAVVSLFVFWCAFLYVAWINVFNFMDGMNGNAGSFGIIAFTTVFAFYVYVAGWDSYEASLLTPYMLALSTTAGFMIFNCRTNASVFLGDSGSHFLGFILAAMALPFYSWTDTGMSAPPLLFSLVLYMPFLYDATFTLGRRFVEGKPFWKAHREHLYQRLMIAGMSHMRVLRVCVCSYILCAVLAFLCGIATETWMKLVSVAASLTTMAAYHAFVLHIEQKTHASSTRKAVTP